MPHVEYDVTASVVLYKTSEADLRAVAQSFLSSAGRIRLIAVDNSPTSVLAHAARSVAAEYIHSEANIGFGAAHNIAIRRYAQASRYHVILNPDVYFSCDVIPRLTNYMDNNPDCGLVMPEVLYPDGTFQELRRMLPSPFEVLARRFMQRARPRFMREWIDRGECKHLSRHEEALVPYLSGCFMFIRSELLAEIGGFDERFFMYFEDVDLCRRIGRRHLTVYYPGATVYHRFARESYKSRRLLIQHCLSAIKYFNHYGWVWDRERSLLNARAASLSHRRTDELRKVVTGTLTEAQVAKG